MAPQPQTPVILISFATPRPVTPTDHSTNLFVSGLTKMTTTEDLREPFSKFGQLIYAGVLIEHFSRYSKGFEYERPRSPLPHQTNGSPTLPSISPSILS
ncbi:organelle RRM domain-containing protein 2, mitochondrial isoform X1 [Cinnamomum micranthum f. kanehirae]|uniref:Organelle RRM domain-containing protein 2, mitochondrial isoform X1 n=1 Tax=Cinnamomum micranthum f. kanehirae TaxID=337451 RepID=A0A443PCD0_9MAGN|nr:organelle RRM domain-containing protein 2, mitochondrial isoform X1 [Cinnamomum micranthum f. kanehirae]